MLRFLKLNDVRESIELKGKLLEEVVSDIPNHPIHSQVSEGSSQRLITHVSHSDTQGENDCGESCVGDSSETDAQSSTLQADQILVCPHLTPVGNLYVICFYMWS